MAALLGALVELGYGVSFRTLDARYSGVPQRRRRVFVLGVRMRDGDPDGHLAADRAAEILALTSGVCRHSEASRAKGPGSASAPRTGLEIAGGLTRRYGKGVNTTLDDGAIVVPNLTGHYAKGGASGSGDGEWDNLVVDQAPDPGRDRAPDGPSGRLDDRPQMAFYIAPESGQGADLTAHEVEQAPAITVTEYERSTDRGVRVVGAFNSTGGSHSVDFDPDLSPPVRIGSGLDIASPPAVFMRSSSGTGNGLNWTDNEAQPLTAAHPGIDAVYVKKSRPVGPDGEGERWDTDIVSPTLNGFENHSDVRAVTLVAATLNSGGNDGGFRTEPGEHLAIGAADGPEDDLLPQGLDSHRYRACGNAVVVNVAEWLGRRIRLAAEGVI